MGKVFLLSHLVYISTTSFFLNKSICRPFYRVGNWPEGKRQKEKVVGRSTRSKQLFLNTLIPRPATPWMKQREKPAKQLMTRAVGKVIPIAVQLNCHPWIIKEGRNKFVSFFPLSFMSFEIFISSPDRSEHRNNYMQGRMENQLSFAWEQF